MLAERPTPWHLAALAGVSAGMLAFEILLLRLFEFSHWHYFAGFAIALALLGMGAAGTTLALLSRRALQWGDRWFLGTLLVMATGLLLVVILQSRLALSPVFAVWDGGELSKLLLVDLAAFIPFYGAGLAIGQVFMRWPRQTARLYACNLLGSGAGAVLASLLLWRLQVETALVAMALALLLLGLSLAWAQRQKPLAGLCLLALLAGLPLAWQPPAPAVSDFKALARLQDLPDSQVLAVQPGLQGRLTLVRSASLRSAPGLSLAWPEAIPATDSVVIGSDRAIPIPRRFPPDAHHGPASLAGLPLQLRPEGEVLVLGASAWQSPVLAGPRHRVTWLVQDRRLRELALQRGAQPPRYRLKVDAPYRHLSSSDSSYRLILVDRAYAEGDAASEDYLLTAEGLALALRRLDPDGLLAIPLPVREPPRHYARLVSTLTEALEQMGVERPGDRVAALRGLQTHLLLASPSALGSEDLAGLQAFAEQWQFDLDWLPGQAQAAETFHRTATPVFQDTARALLTGEGHLPENARWFVSEPARASQPYIWRSLRWEFAPHLLETLGARAMTYLDWSLIFSAATVLLVTVLAFALILVPLGRLPPVRSPFSRLSLAGYFALLGLGYMLLELALFQRIMLFSSQSVVTATVVFGSFLVGSGWGSLSAPEIPSRRTVLWIFGLVGTGFVWVTIGFWSGAEVLQRLGLPLRLLGVVLILLPLAWAMGRPFPWALRQLADQPRWVPWAWGINGFASVAAASLAPLISVHWGQPVTLGAGLACYLLAVVLAVRWTNTVGATRAESGLGFR